MSLAVVLDASVALSAVFPDEHEDETVFERLLGRAEALVPPIWPAEVVNGLQVAVRRGRIDNESADAALGFLSRIPITVTELQLVDYAQQILPLARRHRLSIYDASYLHLAVERRLALATLDKRLEAAARAEKVALA